MSRRGFVASTRATCRHLPPPPMPQTAITHRPAPAETRAMSATSGVNALTSSSGLGVGHRRWRVDRHGQSEAAPTRQSLRARGSWPHTTMGPPPSR
jgi:hypothetical protein